MSFGFYTPFPTDHTKAGSADSTDFPVGILVTDARFKSVGNGGNVQSANGYDVRPYDSAGTTARDYELVSYNATTGAVELYYRQPTLSVSVDGSDRLYYGDAGITTNGSSAAAWNSGFHGVYHFGDGSTLSLADSTSNARNFTNSGGTATTGIRGGGVSFNGSSSMSATMDTAGQPVTISAWFKGSSTGVFLSNLAAGSGWNGSYLEYDGSSTMKGTSVQNDFAAFGQATKAASAGAWHHVAFVASGAASRVLYVDGAVSATETTSVTTGVAPDDLTLGAAHHTAQLDNYSTCVLDEVRISNTARSASWVTAEFNSINSPSTFAVMGSEIALAVSAISSLALPLAGAVAAAVLVTASSLLALPLTAAAAATVAVAASSSSALPLAGSSAATVLVQATSSQSLPLGGSVVGAVLVQATSSLPLPLGGTVAASTGSGLSSFCALPLGGSVAGAVLVQAASSRSLPLAGVAAGLVLVSAVSSRALPLGGAVTATVSGGGGVVFVFTPDGRFTPSADLEARFTPDDVEAYFTSDT